MKRIILPLAAVLIASLASPASAAVTDSQFPPKTVRDLIAICTPANDDPRMTGAINYCHGFAEGAVIVELANTSQRGGHKLFCLPTPAPSSDSELTSFVTWRTRSRHASTTGDRRHVPVSCAEISLQKIALVQAER
ncbi:MAG: hypothetical protein WDN49_14610 [Acetobacteraceae bacterium]